MSVIAADRLPVQNGDTIAGKYKVERTLGIGGMAIVVAAKHLELGQTVALKVMLPAAMERADAGERFLREGRALANIKNQNVAKVLDVGKLDSGEPYLVMEYLEGNDLDQLCTTRGALSVEEAVDFTLQACTALSEAHALGIVHRDVKPGNIFVVPRKDDRPLIKVLDFGISKTPLQLGPSTLPPAPDAKGASIDNTKGKSTTQESALMGSPAYMSPEQMRSSKDVDVRTDVWALGVVLYQLLTGVLPFPGETAQEIFARVIEKPPVPLSQHAMQGYLPDGLEGVVMKSLAKDPAKRFQTVDALAEALRPFAPQRSAPLLARVMPTPGQPFVVDVPKVGAKTVVSWEGAPTLKRTKRRMLIGALVAGVGIAGAAIAIISVSGAAKLTASVPPPAATADPAPAVDPSASAAPAATVAATPDPPKPAPATAAPRSPRSRTRPVAPPGAPAAPAAPAPTARPAPADTSNQPPRHRTDW